MRHEAEIFVTSDTDFCTAPVEVVPAEKVDEEESLLAVEQLLATPDELIDENNFLPSEQQTSLCLIAQQGKVAEMMLSQNKPGITNKEALLHAVERGKKAEVLLIKTNERFYKFFAKRYRGQGVEYEDLLQEGRRVMANAIYGYDPTKGKLSTFAGNRIRGIMKRAVEVAIREKKGISIEDARLLRGFLLTLERLTQKLHRHPTDAEVAEDVGITIENVKDLRQLASNEQSLDKVLPGTENFTLADTLSDGSNVEETVDLHMDSQEVRAALCKLEKIEMQVLLGIYYLGMTEAKIAKKLGVSVKFVKSTYERGIAHLRHILHDSNHFESTFENSLTETGCEEIDEETRNKMTIMIKNLPKSYQNILTGMYFYGKTQCRMALELGVSRQNVHIKKKWLLSYLGPLLDEGIPIEEIARVCKSL